MTAIKYKMCGELLELLRKEKELNQEDVAAKIGVSRSQYCNIETGKCNPSITVLIKLIKLLDVSFDELYGLVQSKRLVAVKKKKVAKLKAEIKSLQSHLKLL